jgi:hypothetical protein
MPPADLSGMSRFRWHGLTRTVAAFEPGRIERKTTGNAGLRRSRKSLGVARRLEGSNPSRSAQPSGAPCKGAPLLPLRRFRKPHRSVHTDPRASTQIQRLWCSLANDWRTDPRRIAPKSPLSSGPLSVGSSRQLRLFRGRGGGSRVDGSSSAVSVSRCTEHGTQLG